MAHSAVTFLPTLSQNFVPLKNNVIISYLGQLPKWLTLFH